MSEKVRTSPFLLAAGCDGRALQTNIFSEVGFSIPSQVFFLGLHFFGRVKHFLRGLDVFMLRP